MVFANVKDFDATGDGVTNDLPAIRAAVVAVERGGGGTVYFPPGTYHVKTDIPRHRPVEVT